MLSSSAQATGVGLDLRSIGDRERSPGRQDASALLRFADALVGRTADLDEARDHLTEVLGAEAIAPAAAAAGNFEMMNRVVDATGVPAPRRMDQLAPQLGLRLVDGELRT